jgi:arylsulfatase
MRRPFCLLVSLDRPHPPCVVPADYAELYDPQRVPLPPAPPPGFVEDDPHVRTQIVRRGWGEMDEGVRRLAVARYLANVTYVDACLGRVLETLADLGYEEDTMVVLLSDHGELLGERGGAYTKYSLYDAALRVPLIVRWPGVSRPGLVSPAPVELVDLMPTWLAAAGLEIPPLLPGRSLRPLLEGQDPAGAGWRTASLSEQYTSVDVPGAPRGQWALRERRYKLVERATGRGALYDLAEDPLEYHNRIDDPALADVRDRLRARLLRDVIARAEQFPARWEPAVAIAPPASAPA